MKTQKAFLQELEQRAKEQARIEESSPLPEWIRPLAATLGEYPWQTLLTLSLLMSVGVSTLSFSFIYKLYERGVLEWLVSR